MKGVFSLKLSLMLTSLALSLWCHTVFAKSVVERDVNLNQSFTLFKAGERIKALRDGPVLCHRIGCKAPEKFDAFLGKPGTGMNFPAISDPYTPNCECSGQVIPVASCAPLQFSGSMCQLNATGKQYYTAFKRETQQGIGDLQGPINQELIVSDDSTAWIPDIRDFAQRFDEVVDGEGRFPLITDLWTLPSELIISKDKFGYYQVYLDATQAAGQSTITLEMALRKGLKQSQRDILKKKFPYASIHLLKTARQSFQPRDQQIAAGMTVDMDPEAFAEPDLDYWVRVSINQNAIDTLTCLIGRKKQLEALTQMPDIKVIDLLMGSLSQEFDLISWESVLEGDLSGREMYAARPIDFFFRDAIADQKIFKNQLDSLESILIRAARQPGCK
jgi:hypothetical protein